MSLNSSNAILNVPLPHTIFDYVQVCWSSRVGPFYIAALSIINNLFLLPLCIFILYLGYRRWRQQRAGTAMSHSDLFTCHMAIIELINIFGYSLCFCGVYADIPEMVIVSTYCFAINLTGQMLFHILTCVERYLAVVHPIMYLSLRKANGIRTRNIITGCVWLLSLAGMSVTSFPDYIFIIIVAFSLVPIVLLIISFCSISVLCTLIRPGPGESGRNRRQVDQPKLRAFYTIVVILGVLSLRFGASVLINIICDLLQMSDDDRCGLWLSQFWFNFPSSLVLPLLFLHRARKVSCCKRVNESVRRSD